MAITALPERGAIVRKPVPSAESVAPITFPSSLPPGRMRSTSSTGIPSSGPPTCESAAQTSKGRRLDLTDPHRLLRSARRISYHLCYRDSRGLASAGRPCASAPVSRIENCALRIRASGVQGVFGNECRGGLRSHRQFWKLPRSAQGYLKPSIRATKLGPNVDFHYV